MASMRSRTGRLVLILGSCGERKVGLWSTHPRVISILFKGRGWFFLEDEMYTALGGSATTLHMVFQTHSSFGRAISKFRENLVSSSSRRHSQMMNGRKLAQLEKNTKAERCLLPNVYTIVE